MADVKGDLSGLSQAGRPTTPKVNGARGAARADGLRLRRLPGRLLGRLRRAGPPGPRHRLRDGPAAARADAQPQRDRRTACSRWCSRSPTTTACCCSTSRTCAPCCSIVGDNARGRSPTEYGNVSAASVGAIQRGLLALEEQGGEQFFGEPTLDLDDLIQTDGDGRGVINILAADKLLMTRPSSTPPSCSGCSPSSSRTCPRSATWTSPSWSSSSTRPTCCSTTRRRRCSTRSSRWCA